MHKIGVYYGRFLPPHRGHLDTIIKASTMCEKLYVVVSFNDEYTRKICDEDNFPYVDGSARVKWLCQQLDDLEHIVVLKLDETNIFDKRVQWEEWCKRLEDLIPDKIDIFFTGVVEDNMKLKECFPEADVMFLDPRKSRYPISSKEIRRDVIKYWDYILGSARPHFTKKILITGTESCGKTTLVRYLAKLYHTSWSEEVGRYYPHLYLGGNEDVYTDEDFHRITIQQFEQDILAMKSANRVVFIDTDATVTQYYSELYMGHNNEMVEIYIDHSRYDLVILLKPDVKWVSDGMRLNGDQERRERLHKKLKAMYLDRGFEDKLVEVGGDYHERLQKVIQIIDDCVK